MSNVKAETDTTQQVRILREDLQQHIDSVKPLSDEAAEKAERVSTGLRQLGRVARRVRSNPCFAAVLEEPTKKT